MTRSFHNTDRRANKQELNLPEALAMASRSTRSRESLKASVSLTSPSARMFPTFWENFSGTAGVFGVFVSGFVRDFFVLASDRVAGGRKSIFVVPRLAFESDIFEKLQDKERDVQGCIDKCVYRE